MSRLLPHDVTAEDRMRRCFFGTRFRRPGDEVEKQGVISGAPVINRGATFDGVNDYITYGLWGQFTDKDPVSFHCLFYPNIVPSGAMTEFPFFDTPDASLNYACRLTTTGTFQFRVGNVSLINIAVGVYSALWNNGGRNLVTLSSTSGASDIMFNGTVLAAAVDTAWTPTVVTSLAIGRRSGARFNGRMESLHLFNSLLSEEDHQAIWAGGGA